ncbi:hypothetical protein [Rheinheimera sp. MM224]|uniref:DUF7660 family protein n=1 Tax=Rheinheimera sp. MM224 TaxID=3019969 RepID=UPI0021F8E9F2|nr:hypothetical protein [Rheinheimera sp. MM224]CAI3798958.1 hypothetical protein JAMGFMIE_02205 [Rheinheimera sp. MM224]
MEIDYEKIGSKEELISLIGRLCAEDTSNWENVSTVSFLEAMAAWLESSGNLYKNLKLDTDSEVASWQIFADAIQAATIYE